jgi:hypothetical protein
MRVVSKILSVVTALVVTAALLGLVASPAQAAKPKHDVTANPRTTASGQTFIKGKVSTYPNGVIAVQRKLPGKTWDTYKTPTTNAKGKYSQVVNGPGGSCFRVVVPGTDVYRKTTVRVGCFEK